MDKYISYLDMIPRVNLSPGEIVYVGSDVLRLIVGCSLGGERFDADIFINTILEKVGSAGTVLFPTFNFDFCRGEKFDYRLSASQTGALSSAALKRADFRRTRHPIYSFAVWGRDQELLVQMDNTSSFGSGTPFEYLFSHKSKMLSIGMDYKLCFAFIHFIEETVGVEYRYQKLFSGTYINESGNASVKTYRMFVRDPSLCEVTWYATELDSVLQSASAFERLEMNGVNFDRVDLFLAGEILMEDLRSNRRLVFPKPPGKSEDGWIKKRANDTY